MGLGYGNISFTNGIWGFSPATSKDPKIFGQNQRLDAFVDKNGRMLVHASRSELRPFKKSELDRIIQVGLCLPCHKGSEDPVMKNWVKGKSPVPCNCSTNAFKTSVKTQPSPTKAQCTGSR